MQRGLSEDWTTPSSVFLIASAGQTWRTSGRRSACRPSAPWRSTVAAIDEIDVDHRMSAMRVALGARVDARLAADAARRIDEEPVRALIRDIGACCSPSTFAYAARATP